MIEQQNIMLLSQQLNVPVDGSEESSHEMAAEAAQPKSEENNETNMTNLLEQNRSQLLPLEDQDMSKPEISKLIESRDHYMVYAEHDNYYHHVTNPNNNPATNTSMSSDNGG